MFAHSTRGKEYRLVETGESKPVLFRAARSASAGQPKTAKLSGLEIQHRSAALEIERHRGVVVCDEPFAVDFLKTHRRANPETAAPVPVLQRPAEPIEAVRECHVTAQGDREVANLKTERMLE